MDKNSRIGLVTLVVLGVVALVWTWGVTYPAGRGWVFWAIVGGIVVGLVGAWIAFRPVRSLPFTFRLALLGLSWTLLAMFCSTEALLTYFAWSGSTWTVDGAPATFEFALGWGVMVGVVLGVGSFVIEGRNLLNKD